MLVEKLALHVAQGLNNCAKWKLEYEYLTVPKTVFDRELATFLFLSVHFIGVLQHTGAKIHNLSKNSHSENLILHKIHNFRIPI